MDAQPEHRGDRGGTGRGEPTALRGEPGEAFRHRQKYERREELQAAERRHRDGECREGENGKPRAEHEVGQRNIDPPADTPEWQP